MIRDFFLGFTKIHILYHATQSPVCGIERVEELKRHGYRISPETLYPALHSLQKKGYLESTKRIVGGWGRKYYEAEKK